MGPPRLLALLGGSTLALALAFLRRRKTCLNVLDTHLSAAACRRPSPVPPPLTQAEAITTPRLGGHMGDLMSTGPSASSSFAALPDSFAPLERVLLTANGNLQRIISSYYNCTVTVRLIHNRNVAGRPGAFDREVRLYCRGQDFCTAVSEVEITDAAMLQAVASGRVGLGQLFRAFNVLPTFELEECGRRDCGGIWRRYALRGCGVSCRITEYFKHDVLCLAPN